MSSEYPSEKLLAGVLNSLLESQFDEVLFRLHLGTQISSRVPQIQRTKELLEILRGEEAGLNKLKDVILKVVPHMKSKLTAS